MDDHIDPHIDGESLPDGWFKSSKSARRSNGTTTRSTTIGPADFEPHLRLAKKLVGEYGQTELPPDVEEGMLALKAFIGFVLKPENPQDSMVVETAMRAVIGLVITRAIAKAKGAVEEKGDADELAEESQE